MTKIKHVNLVLLSSLLTSTPVSFGAKTKSQNNNPAPATKLADSNPNQIKRIAGNKKSMSTVPTVLAIEVVKPAPANAPYVNVGQTATVNYTGWLHDQSKADKKGALFDSSKKPGRTPFKFKVGANQVIAGWDKGLPKMQVGGTYLVTIPSDMGYGARGAGAAIPPNATLLFEIEVLSAS